MSPSPKEWPGFDLTVPADLMDAAKEFVSASLAESDFLGTAREEKPVDAAQSVPARDPVLRIYLCPKADAARCAKAIKTALERSFPESFAAGRLRLAPFSLPDDDWVVRWKEFFWPIRVSQRIIILPAWWSEKDGLRHLGLAAERKGRSQTDGEDREKIVIVRIEPGRAFGSGNHATTQLALCFLEEAVHRGTRALDFGAGSGILSFAAALLGAESVAAIEADGECFDNFSLNLRLNRLERRIDYRIGSSEMIRPRERFDVIVSNILFKNARPHLAAVAQHLAPEGEFLLSGFLSAEMDLVREHLEMIGLKIVETQVQEEWGAARVTRSLSRAGAHRR